MNEPDVTHRCRFQCLVALGGCMNLRKRNTSVELNVSDQALCKPQAKAYREVRLPFRGRIEMVASWCHEDRSRAFAMMP